MHESSLRRMEWFIKTHLNEEKDYEILDVGSYDVNGSYKQFFKDTKFRYTGLDMEHGPNVDIVPTQHTPMKLAMISYTVIQPY